MRNDAAVLPLDAAPGRPLYRLLVCGGPTCGLNPDLQATHLRNVWEAEGLGATVGLRISACQDCCEHASVARIFLGEKSEWYERLTAEDYSALLDWARACHRGDALLPRPECTAAKAFGGRSS